MADNQPTPGQTLAVLLGACEYELAPTLAAQGAAFENSSADFKKYLIGTMRVPRENIASLFNDKRSASDQLGYVGDFLERRTAALEKAGTEARDLIVHYVGHGLFSGGGHDYYLAICSTKEQKEGITSIRFRDLANAIRDPAARLRKYFILDCCFSGAAVDQFQGDPLSVVEEGFRDDLLDDSPTRGTTMLCSASRRDASLAPEGMTYTMFSDSLLSALKEGDKLYDTRISLFELGELVRHRIKKIYKDDGVHPEVHTPDHRKGDVARVRLFPNLAHPGLNRETEDEERARREREERERAEAEQRRIEAEEEERKGKLDAARLAQAEQDQRARDLAAKALEEKRKKRRRKIRVAIVVALASLAIYLLHPWTLLHSWTRDQGTEIFPPPHWQSQFGGTTNNLHSIFGTQDGWHLWAVGDKGTILQSDDAGLTWRDRTSGTNERQHSIFGTQDLRHLWAVGDKGTILQSADGGATWKARPSGTTNELHSIFGTQDGTHLWTVGKKGTILESDDDGATWQARTSGTTDNLNSIFGATHGEHLWAVGENGTILQSDDLGATWLVRPSGTTRHLHSIFRATPVSHLWVVGDKGTMLQSADGGATWKARNSGTTEALISVLGTPDGSHLWAVGYKATILLSYDAGVTWRIEMSVTTNNLLSISGNRDGKRLCAVGDGGTILQFDASNQ